MITLFIFLSVLFFLNTNSLTTVDGRSVLIPKLEGAEKKIFLSESTNLEMWDNSNSCGKQKVHTRFSICPGDSVFLQAEQVFPTPPPGPQGPDGSPPPHTPCTPQLEAIEICPFPDALAVGITGFRVAPTVNTVYRLRSIGYCGPIAPDDFTQTQYDTIDIFYEVLIDCPNGGNKGHPVLFEDYPWLSTIVNPNNCTSESIRAYQAGFFTYIYINNGDDTGSLYLGDGTFYCSSTSSYDCVGAYHLSEIIATWTCKGTVSEDPIFTAFSWLNSLFDPADCTNYHIAIYNQVVHNYLLVNNQLYYQDGTFYCQSSSTFDCVTAYNFGEAIYEWNCHTGGSGILPTPLK